MNKLIFFDIDNTILDHSHKGIVPKSALFALQKLREEGNVVGIASGKGLKYIETFIPKFGFDTYVALNGNVVKYQGKVIFEDSFDKSELDRFIKYCIEKNYPLMCGDVDGTKTIWPDDSRIKDYYDVFNMAYPKVIKSFDELGPIHQMSIAIKEEHEQEVMSTFPNFEYARMNDYGMNVNPGGGSKEKGLKHLLDYLNRSVDDLVVFGDGLNDIGMFKLAKTSIAMGNADPELKKYATFITDDVSENGLYKACVALHLIKEDYLDLYK